LASPKKTGVRADAVGGQHLVDALVDAVVLDTVAWLSRAVAHLRQPCSPRGLSGELDELGLDAAASSSART